jgi:hypothetical protein
MAGRILSSYISQCIIANTQAHTLSQVDVHVRYTVCTPLSDCAAIIETCRVSSLINESLAQDLQSVAHQGSHFKGICGYMDGLLKCCLLCVHFHHSSS